MLSPMWWRKITNTVSLLSFANKRLPIAIQRQDHCCFSCLSIFYHWPVSFTGVLAKENYLANSGWVEPRRCKTGSQYGNPNGCSKCSRGHFELLLLISLQQDCIKQGSLRHLHSFPVLANKSGQGKYSFKNQWASVFWPLTTSRHFL